MDEVFAEQQSLADKVKIPFRLTLAGKETVVSNKEALAFYEKSQV